MDARHAHIVHHAHAVAQKAGGQRRLLCNRRIARPGSHDKYLPIARRLGDIPHHAGPRLDADKADALWRLGCDFAYEREARAGVVGDIPDPTGNGEILVVTAGTSDAPVAEEAALTARFLGNRVRVVHDVGVAGIHRLLAHGEDIARAQVIVAVAGMEGALPSVVAGLASCPVIAVPTSVGYGASLGGVTALLAMVNSCASGVSVVNIDNGFGAAYQASLINHLPGGEELGHA